MVKEQAVLEKTDYRLPESTYPVRYRIHLSPDLKDFIFEGVEEIDLEIGEASDHILLNALDLEILEACLTEGHGGEGGGSCISSGISGSGTAKAAAKSGNGNVGKTEVFLTNAVEADKERVKLTAPEKIEAGSYTLRLKFRGQINDKLRGFYRSAQALKNGEKSWIALTQFEATDARRAFPCFDEPAFKATFKLSLTVDEKLQAISNTPIESENLIPGANGEGGKRTIHFKETMKMSTYIVAFVVGELEVSEAVMVDGVPMRIYAPLGKGHLSKFALEIGSAALSFFNKYYGISYPGEKMDMIAVPDFAFGAMENLGAVIYRENALLVDPAKASHAELERVADVVAHELAHMWFGNLTTMKWWNGIWLNEAFATFMELVAVDNFRPHWKRWETFGVSRAAAFATDGLRATRKIEYPVCRPEEANGMFDVLTYEKGASVLRMLEQYIGAEKFKSGVNEYLAKHKYANTETHDLWDALGEASGEPVQEIMNSWIFQEGHPLVSVSLGEDGKSLKLSQERFFYLAGEKGDEIYQVPLLLKAKTAKGMVEKRHLLHGQSDTVSFDDNLEWVLVNAGGHGFYRVSYDAQLLDAIKSQLPDSQSGKSTAIGTLERFNLVSDAFALTQAGKLKLADFIAFVKLFTLEPDKNVWTVIATAIQYIDRVLGKDAKMAELTREILAPTYKCLGFEGPADESEFVRQMRALTIQALGTVGGDSEVIAQSRSRYAAHKSGKTLSADVLSAVVPVLAANGDEKLYEEFSESFVTAASPQESDRFMYALALFPNEKLLAKTLEKTLKGEVKGQSAPYLVRNVLLNPDGRRVGWDFVKNNWDEIKKLFPSLILTRLVEGVSGLSDEDIAKEVFKFFEEHPVKEGQKTCDQHIEKLRVALAFKRTQKC